MMNFEYQNVAGYKLRLARVAQGGRPTLVLTNAFPQSIRCWESTWDRLAEYFDLLAVDLAGFGMSEGSGSIMRPSAQADLLVQVMDANNIDKAFFVGPDVGVPVTLFVAATQPDRVLGLNIYDGPGMWPTEFAPELKAGVESGMVRWFGTRWPMRSYLMNQNYKAATAAGYHHFEPSESVKQEYREICFDAAKHQNAFDFLGSYAEELPRLQKKLTSIQVPVLITWGAHDKFVTPSNAHRLHETLLNSELTIFENAGHFSHEDADDAWLERLATFVGKHSGSQARQFGLVG